MKKVVFPLEILVPVAMGTALFHASISLLVLLPFILFVFGDVTGHTHVDGGSGAWTDVIEIDMAQGPGADTSQGGWTVEIDGQKLVDGHEHGSIDTQGKHVKIETENGSIDIDNIDKIDW